jgi:mannose-6-phosphate isomerase-like protein (cupin superfamily)
VSPRIARLCALVPLGILLALTLAARSRPPAVFDALLSGRMHVPLEELASRAPLGPGQSFRVAPIGRDAHTSHHVVTIRDREVPHRHDRHDLVVVMLRGHGHMRLGDEERPVGEGSVLYVPRGTPHAFRNESDAPAVAYAMYAPAFDGEDRVTVE